MPSQCSRCRYFHRAMGEPLFGECRRHAPPLPDRGRLQYHKIPLAVWPVVQADDGCGDFFARETDLPVGVRHFPSLKSFVEVAIGDLKEQCLPVTPGSVLRELDGQGLLPKGAEIYDVAVAMQALQAKS